MYWDLFYNNRLFIFCKEKKVNCQIRINGVCDMNIGFYACLIIEVIFAIMTIVFTILGDKAAVLISGFNTLTQEQRSEYDMKRMCMEQRNSMLIWTVIMLVGTLFSCII